MRGVRAGLAAFAVALFVLPASAAAGAGSRRAIVLLDREVPSKAAVHAPAPAILARNGLRRARPDVPQVGVMTVDVPSGTSFRRLAARLERQRGVRRVERDSQHQLRFEPS